MSDDHRTTPGAGGAGHISGVGFAPFANEVGRSPLSGKARGDLAQQLVNAAEREGVDTYTKTMLWQAATALDHDGWQLVPKVLSADMIRAAINAWIAQGRKPGDIWGSEIGDMWRAMLAAAPELIAEQEPK